MNKDTQATWMLHAKKADFSAIGQRFHISPVTARLIRNRNVVGAEAIDRYLNGTIRDLYDPHILKDMDPIVEILKDKFE